MKHRLDLDFLSLLAAATREGGISWRHVGGDGYRSTSEVYNLSWLYWYRVDGITIGRMGLIVAIQDQSLAFPWGTEGMEVAKQLLNEIDGKWISYHFGLVKGCKEMLPNDLPSTPVVRMQQPCIMVLSLLRQATQAGEILWRQDRDNPNSFYSHFNHKKMEITFRQPADYDENPIGNLVVELLLEGANIPFACGTDGYFLIEEILSFSIPDYQRAIRDREAALAREIESLRRMIRQSPAEEK
ncbi:hypothetical protein [Lignipirellula cremea]|uniref:Uncharacterized protein n=1 Tax=Lignipirellula cremea TaxID=2528010 RepID=A0A518DLE2_9BACT|nr:hypothetical protein [Lignipirellula cremea]QDU92653.1 hypothetical protein Pla8534_04010 [Lignipirellula cremea]